jgi:hypothetical protein
MSPHSIINMKVSYACDHLFHEECGSSITNVEHRLCGDDAPVAHISGYNSVTSQHIYRRLPNMCSANKQELCSVVGVANADPKKVPHVPSIYHLL